LFKNDFYFLTKSMPVFFVVVQKYSNTTNNKIKHFGCEELKTKGYKSFIKGGDYKSVK
jgi:hypothetical protein